MSRGEYYENIPISPENLEKMMKNRQDVAGLERVPIWCPRCKKVADRVYIDATGHKDIRCYDCKLEFVTTLPQVRTIRMKREKDEKEPYRWW